MPCLSNMADQSAAGSSGSSGTRSSRERAVNLLRVVQNLLERNDDVEQGQQRSQDEAGPSASGEQSSTRGEVVKKFSKPVCQLLGCIAKSVISPATCKKAEKLLCPKRNMDSRILLPGRLCSCRFSFTKRKVGITICRIRKEENCVWVKG